MSTHAVPLCIVGLGSIARTHLTVLRTLNVAVATNVHPSVTAIATNRVAQVSVDAASLGVDRVGSLADFLTDPSIAAFDVTSRNVDHFQQASAILAAGRALYLEKPAGTDAAQADELAVIGSRVSAVSQIGFVMRYHRATIETKALLHSAAIGQVRLVRMAILRGGYLDSRQARSWKVDRDLAGGGAMLDLGIHLVDLLRFLVGPPKLRSGLVTFVARPQDVGEVVDKAQGVDDWAWAEFVLPDGARASVEASRVSYGAEESPIQLFGTEGSIRFDLTSGSPPVFSRFDGRTDEFRKAAARDEECAAIAALLPSQRLTLGPFVDSHFASLHHFLLRVSGADPAPGSAPGLADAAVAQGIVEQVSQAM